MDLATLIGIVLGFGLILTTMAQGVGIGAFMDVGSGMIVIGGTLASTLIFQRLTHVLSAGKVMMQAFFDQTKPIEDLIPVINQRAFQANTRTISVTNELLANLVSLGG